MLINSCDSTFEPIQPSDDITFSIFGTLDLHADTQWVRVMPIGEKLLADDPNVERAKVTLTRMETGEVVTLEDSLFAFRNNTYVLNYWTDTPLHSEEDYLLQAETADGRISRAQVSIPSPLPRPQIDYSLEEERGLVEIPTDDLPVVVESKFVVQELTPFGPAPAKEIAFSHLDHLFLTDDGTYRFRVEGGRLIYNELETSYQVLDRELVIAKGSKDWPDLSDLTEEEIPVPDNYSNVENGTGLVVGVASRTASLE